MIFFCDFCLMTYADDGFGNCLHLSYTASAAALYFLHNE